MTNQRDLYQNIEKGDFPRWTMLIHAMPEKDAAKCPYDPFDLTKVWFHRDHPLIEVGAIELNRNPEIYFAEVEQSAFNPVNAPRCPSHSYLRDGAMRVDGDHGSTLGYEPNGYGEWQQQSDFTEPPLSLEGAAGHWNHRADDDYCTQPARLFRPMPAEQQKVLFANTGRAMGDASREIKIRHIGNCPKADAAYGKGVADALGIPLGEMPTEA